MDKQNHEVIGTITSKINVTPQRCLLVDFEVTLDFSSSKFTCPYNNISQICYCGQISLQSAAVNCTFFYNLTPLGVTFILQALAHYYHLIIFLSWLKKLIYRLDPFFL